MKRILISILLVASTIIPTFGQTQAAAGDFTRALSIPPILENTGTRSGEVVLNLVAQKGRTELLAGKPTDSLGYNGDYLGPTIRVSRGDRVRMSVQNTLNEDTTVHWHGLHVPGEMDGGPRQVIAAGTTWKPEFTINQEAATLWYHPHLLGKTAEHVYRGMAGMFIIDDERSEGLGLPKTYGVDDIPLVLQDRRLSADGKLTYRPRMPDIMHGLHGNVMLVNGAHRPFVEVPAGLVRLRVLNGSNSTVYRLSLGDGSPYRQIASDGGFLERPLEQTYTVLSPGERVEIVIDFGAYKAGASVNLVNEVFQGEVFQALQFKITGNSNRGVSVPARLNEITRFDESGADKTRRFVLSTMGRGGQLTINGKHMDMDRIDERVTLGDMEIWELSNRGMGMGMMEQIPHSMHLHDVQFQVLSIDGEPPPANLMGWKDTVLIWPGETVRIAARFEDYTGIYMYHCHFLEHEDAGMMGQFEVVR